MCCRHCLTAHKQENGSAPTERTELMAKPQHDNNASVVKTLLSDETRSHISGVSSHNSSSHPSSSMRSATTYQKYAFPRCDLHTLGLLGGYPAIVLNLVHKISQLTSLYLEVHTCSSVDQALTSSIVRFKPGKGTFGEVLLARANQIRHNEVETLVVVKSLQSLEERDQIEFRREMDMFGKMNHPNIVKLLGVCRDMEPQFMITEYCEWVRCLASGSYRNKLSQLTQLKNSIEHSIAATCKVFFKVRFRKVII